MHNHHSIFLVILLFTSLLFQPLSKAVSGTPASVEVPSESVFVSMMDASPVNIKVTENHTAIDLELSIDFLNRTVRSNGIAYRIPNEGLSGGDGMPQLPAIGRWVRVPDRGRLELSYQIERIRREVGEAPVMSGCTEQGDDVDRYGELKGIWPPEPVVMGKPMIMRGVRMVPLSFYPVRWDADAGEYIISEGFNVSIRSVGGIGENEVETLLRRPSHDFDRLLEALLVNPPRRDQPDHYLPGGYLLVANDDYPEAVDEFADWKRSAGHPVEILTFDPEITTTESLRELILDIYRDYRFEHIVFFGNEDADPPLQIPFQVGWDGYYDVYFAQLEGDDPLPDATVGSFNCLTEDNLICAVRRAISYQSEPYIDDAAWFTKAGVAVGECSVPDDLSPSYTGKWVAEVLRRQGFDDISTSFYSDDGPNDPTPMIADLYNSRTNFILVRAHQNNFDADEIEETGVYPFHFLVSSGTLSGAFNRAFRMGTPDDMRGPSAGFGHAGSPRTNVANALAGGLMEALFFLDIDSYGWAKNYAVANLIRVMPDDDADYVFGYYRSWRYYGDPGQWCWRGVPEELNIVECPETIDPDATLFSVRVTEEDNIDEAVPDALVCLTQEDGIHSVSRTDVDGMAHFTFERGVLNENDLNITVTGENLYPASEVVQVEEEEMFVALIGFDINDEGGGDGDGVPNPGEEVFIVIELENSGDHATDNWLVVEYFSSSPWVRLWGEINGIERLEPGERVEIGLCFADISNGCPDGESILVIANIEEIATVGFLLEIEAPSLEFADIELMDRLEPGLETEFQVYVANRGRVNTEELEARLESMSPFILVTNPAAVYSPIEVDDTIENDDPFGVRATENTIPGSTADFRLTLEGDPGVLDTLYFSLPVGEAVEGDPLGPDSYGYIALDNEDDDVEWAEAPEYDWLDINEWHGDVEGHSLDIGREPPDNDEADSTVLVELPFPMRYYGEEFNEISVCSNGWIAVGDQTALKNQQNWVMPGFDGAFGMMAVFWDRIHYAFEDDGVFVYHDENRARFIIQWDCIVENDQDAASNVFQAIIFDPDEYPTPTGDNRIIFQYRTVGNIQDQWEANAYCTVGISSPDGLDGLTYTYWNDYPPSCAVLEDGRAILWTTIRYPLDTGTITGCVTRYIDSTAVAGATVRASNDFQTITDQDGEYRLVGVEPGTFDITVTAEDYGEITEEDFELEADDEIELDFVLPHGWLVVDPDTLFINDSLFHGGPWEIELGLSNDGNFILVIEEITCNCEYFFDFPENFEIEAGESAGLIFTMNIDDLEPGHYEYEISMINNSPISPYIVPIIVDVMDVIRNQDLEIPDDFILSFPYPNPFNSLTTISFGLPKDSDVGLYLFDLTGRRIGTLTAGRFVAGWHRTVIDATDIATGLYFVRLEAGDFSSIRRVLLVR